MRITDLKARLRIVMGLQKAKSRRSEADTVPVRSGAMQPCKGELYGDTHRDECKGCLRFDPAAEHPITPAITAVTVRRIYCNDRLPG